MKTLFWCIPLLLVFEGCTSSINSTSGSTGRIRAHNNIAILPFEVRFDLRNQNRKRFTEKELAEVRHFMATGLQEHLYRWLNRYSNKKTFTVTIQDVDVTDSILAEKKISYLVLYSMGRRELANLLGVDAVLTPNVIFAQPNSEAMALVTNLVSGMFFNELATQEMRMQVLLTDMFSETPLWTFETQKKSSKSTFVTRKVAKEEILYPLFENIDKSLIRFIRHFPYTQN